MQHILRRAYLWACERLYHELAWAYDAVAWAVSLGAWAQWRRAVLPLRRPGPLLELGSGTGALLAEAAAGAPALGLERSLQMLRVAARRARRAGKTLPCVQADARCIPCAGGSFATVVATFPAPYIADARTLAEVARVLRPGGLLLIGGLWVTPRARLLRMLPVFYGTRPDALLVLLEARLAAAGLEMRVQEVAVGRAAVGIVVAEKMRA